MNIDEKNKLEHDFLNSLVVIKSMAKSAASFAQKISMGTESNATNQNQMDKFLLSMNIIQDQALKLENYFNTVLNK